MYIHTQPSQQCRLGTNWLGRSSSERTWWAVSWALAAERPKPSWTVWTGAQPGGWRKWLFPFPHQGCIQSNASSFGASSVEAPQDAQGAEAPALWGEAARLGWCILVETALGVLTGAPNTYGEVTKELEPGFSQQWMVGGWETMSKSWKKRGSDRR